jgi:hypothetical protein
MLWCGKMKLRTEHFAAGVERRARGIAAASIGPEARKSNSRSTARQRAVDEFLLLTFDAAAGTVTWSHLAMRLSDLVGGRSAMFFSYDARSRQTNMLATSELRDGAMVARFVEAAEELEAGVVPGLMPYVAQVEQLQTAS